MLEVGKHRVRMVTEMIELNKNVGCFYLVITRLKDEYNLFERKKLN